MQVLGVVLISGALGGQVYAADPTVGVVLGVTTGFAYAGFLMLLRSSNPAGSRPLASLRDATAVAAVGLAAVALAAGEGAALVPS